MFGHLPQPQVQVRSLVILISDFFLLTTETLIVNGNAYLLVNMCHEIVNDICPYNNLLFNY